MSATRLPNILILMTDQQRADCLGCAGHPVLRTPHMDRIAAEGVRFSQATTVSPVCMPARASFVNSLYPHNHGMWGNHGQMPAEDETFFHHLQHAGYCTAHIGKSHYYDHRSGEHMRDHEPYMHARGIEHVHETTGPWATTHTRSYMTDYWESKGIYQAFIDDYRNVRKGSPFCVDPSPHSEEDYQDSYIGRTAVEYIDGYEDDRPLCLFVGLGGPHEPFDAPGKYATMYDPAAAPAFIPVSGRLAGQPAFIRESGYFDPHKDFTPDKVPPVQASYFGRVALLDDWFGRIIGACGHRGWLDDLVIVHWSDHGEMLGDHGKLNKSVFLESALRVPLSIRWPGRIGPGMVSDAPAEIIDVFPTLLEGLGLAPSARALGRSLLACANDPGAPLRDFQLSEINRPHGRRIMISSRKYKYAVDDQSRGFMLFDLENDPGEQDNLAGQPGAAALEAELREALLKRLVEAQYSM